MTTTLFGIRNCDTMKKAWTWLDQHGVAYGFHDYKKQGVDRAQRGQVERDGAAQGQPGADPDGVHPPDVHEVEGDPEDRAGGQRCPRRQAPQAHQPGGQGDRDHPGQRDRLEGQRERHAGEEGEQQAAWHRHRLVRAGPEDAERPCSASGRSCIRQAVA